jgi:hypothetical protein
MAVVERVADSAAAVMVEAKEEGEKVVAKEEGEKVAAKEEGEKVAAKELMEVAVGSVRIWGL